MKLVLAVCVAFVLSAAPASAQTTRVVDDDGQASITDCDATIPAFAADLSMAMFSFSSGDTVLVCPGIYGGVQFLGKNMVLRSTHGPDVTILHGSNMRSVVEFTGGETRSAVLEGFTIRNGRGLLNGGGIRIRNASPTIRGNRIVANTACVGGGIDIFDGSPLIEDNTIAGNTLYCDGSGGAIAVSGVSSTPFIRRNHLSANEAAKGGAIFVLSTEGTARIELNVISGNRASIEGGAIHISGIGPQVAHNLIVGNSAPRGGGLSLGQGGATTWLKIFNNTIAANPSSEGSAVAAAGIVRNTDFVNNILVASPGQVAVHCINVSTPPRFDFNDVFAESGTRFVGCADPTGTANNIAADPRFVDLDGGDYRLQADSANIDAGRVVHDPPSTDIGGRARTLDGNGDGIPVIDIGAYEFGVHPRDLIGDGTMSLIFKHETDGDLVAWKMREDTRLSASMLSPARVGAGWRLAGAADFNGDRQLDLLWQHLDGDLVVWFMNGTARTGFAYLSIPRPVDAQWQVVSVADMNGDRQADVVWQHATTRRLAVWFLDGTTVVSRQSMIPDQPLDLDWVVVATADFNLDGRADLVWKHQTLGYLAVWLMDGVTRTAAVPIVPQLVDVRWEVAAVGDLTGDGVADIVFQHPDGSLYAWRMMPVIDARVFRLGGIPLSPGVVSPGWRLAGPR